jgi:hypothetical protein
MDKTEFVRDFTEFNSEMKKNSSDLETGDITMLYAVYRKDLRASRLNNGHKHEQQEQMATEKQKRYLLKLAKTKGAKLTESDINKMTRQQASKAIDTLLEGV